VVDNNEGVVDNSQYSLGMKIGMEFVDKDID
jgi:hypothetical protein